MKKSLIATLCLCLFSCTSLSADTILLETWHDDSVGASPNGTPDLGAGVFYLGGSYQVFDEGNASKGLRVTDPDNVNAYAVQYRPNDLGQIVDLAIEYTFQIDGNSSLLGVNAMSQTLDFSNSNISSVQFHWADNQILYYQISDGALVDTGVSFDFDTRYLVEWQVDLMTDRVSIAIDGNSLFSNVSLGTNESTVNHFVFDSNFDSSGTADIGFVQMNATAVPEPSGILLIVAMVLPIGRRCRRMTATFQESASKLRHSSR